jgi:hypothetical protein
MTSILSESVLAALLCYGQTGSEDYIGVHYGVQEVCAPEMN